MDKIYKIKELKQDVRYVCVKGGTTIVKGDHVHILKDGSLLSQEGQGWLEEAIWKRFRNEFVIDMEYYDKAIAYAKKLHGEAEQALKQIQEEMRADDNY